MNISLERDLEAALSELARQHGVTLESLVQNALRERFLTKPETVQPRDDWERRLLGAVSDCSVSLPHSALSSEELYE